MRRLRGESIEHTIVLETCWTEERNKDSLSFGDREDAINSFWEEKKKSFKRKSVYFWRILSREASKSLSSLKDFRTSLGGSSCFKRHKCVLPELLQRGPPSVFPVSFQSVGTVGLERAVSGTVAATVGFVTNTRGNASATPAGLGTAVILVREVPSADSLS